MELKEYLLKNKIKVFEFAEDIDYSRQQVFRILNGRYVPGKKFIKIVESITNGEVTKEDLLRNYKGKNDSQ